jgi:hypothetical protein
VVTEYYATCLLTKRTEAEIGKSLRTPWAFCRPPLRHCSYLRPLKQFITDDQQKEHKGEGDADALYFGHP